MDGIRGDVIGVQVKRYREKIKAHQIREFAGAIVVNGMTKGIFITTSSYTAGAQDTTAQFAKRQLAIDLWDADRFYSALKVGRRPMYVSALDPEAPFYPLIRDVSKIPFVSERRMPTGY